ncbi:MAG TPA: hypothetical protein VGK73_40345, partial [Polyangiaceae bacterium]
YDPAAGTPPGPLAKNLHADFSLPEVDLELWRTDGQPGHPFFQLFEPLAGPPALRETRLHPWVDHTFSSEVAASVLKRLCYRPPRALDYGVVGLIFIRRGPEPAPLLMVPETTGLLWGIGMFAEFPAYARSEAIAIMAEYAEALRPYGGTRYLSGFRPFEGASGKEYYGRHGQRFWETKTRHDHKHLLNAGFFEDEASSREASA